MAVDIGPKIGIDGEAEFRKELNNINQQIKTLGSEMKAVTSAFDASDKSQEALTAQTGVLNRQIEAQEKKLSSLQSMLDKSSQKYGENDTKTLRWAQAVQDATADLNRMRGQLSKTEREMDGLGDATDDVADAMDEVGSASSGLGDTLKSAILGGGIVAGIQSIVGGIKDLVESTTEYRRIAASLEVSSQAAGYSAKETAATYQQLYGVLGDDQTAATATANLQAVGLAQEQLTQLTNAAIGAWATYGDSIPIDGLSEAINETIKVGKVTGTFADALNWAGVSEDAFNAKLEAASTPAERANLVLQQLASQGLVQAGEAWRTTNSDIVAANEATAQLTETISEFGTIFSPIVTSAKENINGLLNGVLQVVQAFQEDGLSGAVSEAGTQLTALASSASSIASSIATGIMNGLPLLAETASTLMGNLGQYLAENLPAMIQSGLSAVTAFTGSLAENAGLVVDAAIGLAKSLAQGLADSIPAIIENVPTIVSNIARVINENAPKVFAAAVELIVTLVKGLIDSIPTIVENIPKIIKAIIDAFLAFNWLNLGKTIITGIGSGLKSMISFVKDIAGQIVSAIKGGISALPGQMLTIGKNIVRGLWDGVKSMGKWVLDNIKKFVGGIVGGIKEFLGIHSPSTVFRDEIGKNIGLGVAEGIEDSSDDAVKAANELAKSVYEKSAEWIERQAKYQGYGLKEQLEVWEAIQDQFIAESRQYAQAEEKIFDLKQQVQDEYYSKVEEVQSKITKLEQDYQDKLADRTQEIFSAYDLFDQVPERQKVSGDKLVKNLEGQIATIEEFYDGLRVLSERGVGDALVDDIRNMGPDAVDELNALLSLSDEKLSEYAALYQEKQALANELATQELAGLRGETSEQISQSLLELRQIYDEYAPVVGEALPDGLAEGIRNGISSVISAAAEMAQSAVSVVKDTLGIHSPSLVFAGLGKNSAKGFSVGFENEMTDVAARMQRSIPVPTIDTVNNAAAGMVNGLSTMAAGQSFPSTIVLRLENGAEVARWLLPDLRRAGQANPEVVSGV